MGADDWEHMVPWVRRAVDAAPDPSLDVLIDALVVSLRQELASLHSGTQFTVSRYTEEILVEWAGQPEPSDLADQINVDPTYPHPSGVEVGSLYGEDLPESLWSLVVLLKHQP